MKRPVWTPAARHDLLEIDTYWLSVAEHHADAVLDRIYAAGQFLSDVPHAGGMVSEQTRKWTVRGTRYVLVYRVEPDAVFILRVRHQAENWREDEP